MEREGYNISWRKLTRNIIEKQTIEIESFETKYLHFLITNLTSLTNGRSENYIYLV